jgi:hypothetical protein
MFFVDFGDVYSTNECYSSYHYLFTVSTEMPEEYLKDPPENYSEAIETYYAGKMILNLFEHKNLSENVRRTSIMMSELCLSKRIKTCDEAFLVFGKLKK